MLETFNAFVTKINGFVWGPVMLILLIGMLLSTRKRKKTRGEEHEKH